MKHIKSEYSKVHTPKATPKVDTAKSVQEKTEKPKDSSESSSSYSSKSTEPSRKSSMSESSSAELSEVNPRILWIRFQTLGNIFESNGPWCFFMATYFY